MRSSAAWCWPRRHVHWDTEGSHGWRGRRASRARRSRRGCGSSWSRMRPRSECGRLGVAASSCAIRIPPALVTDLEALVNPDTRGDPMSPLRWTCKSTRQLAGALNQAGHRVSDRRVAALLHAARYSLQANAKVLEGTQHADRNAQFQYLNEQVKQFLAAGQPVVSMDAKKKLRHEVARSEWTRRKENGLMPGASSQ